MNGKYPHQAARSLRDFRARRGWTQEALAAELGVSRVQVARWESGLALPRTRMMNRLSALGACAPGAWFEPIERHG